MFWEYMDGRMGWDRHPSIVGVGRQEAAAAD